MASSKPVIYAKVHMTQNHMDEFRAKLKVKGRRGLDRAGREGAQVARARMTRNRTGATRRSIKWYREPWSDKGSIIVGTLAGAVQEFGSKERSGRGRVTPLKFLRAGFAHTMQRVVGEVRRA